MDNGHGEASNPLVEVCKTKRADRVYSCAMDAKGAHLVVGGRDKMVAMYDTARPGDDHCPLGTTVEALLMWEITADDFVYCVALSSDMQFVAYGGTSKKASSRRIPPALLSLRVAARDA